MTKANLPVPGATVSHYRVLNAIAGGGMGVVFRAEDVKLGRAVALKFLPEQAGDDPVALARFEREARTASSLNHANICTIYEVEEHEGTPFIVMEYLEGMTLRNIIAQAMIASPSEKAHRPPMSVVEIVDMGMQIADGLDFAHRKGIIHRDVKPANIFITRERQVKILDFGLAKLVATTHDNVSDQSITDRITLGATTGAARPEPDSALTRAGASLGTTGYMSPEQVEGLQLDARSDIFCMGLVLYEAATGRRAFAGGSKESYRQALLHEPLIPVRELNPAIPAALEAILYRCLEKNCKLRYPQAAEVRKDLKPIQRELSALSISKTLVAERIAQAESQAPKRPSQTTDRLLGTKSASDRGPTSRLVTAIIAALVIAVVIGIVMIILRPHGP